MKFKHKSPRECLLVLIVFDLAKLVSKFFESEREPLDEQDPKGAPAR